MTETTSSSVVDLLAAAHRVRLTRSHIAAFSHETPLAQMRDAFAAAIANDDLHAATLFALAIAAAGGSIPRDLAIRLFPDLVPHFSSAASRALTELPERVAADALRLAALLAGGDGHAWSGVKHMRRAHDVLSARIGLSHRLLFHAGEDRLEILDLVRRRDLDAAIQRLRRK